MKLATFEKGSRARVGAVDGDRVIDLGAAHAARVRAGMLTADDQLKSLPTSMIDLLEAGEPALRAAAAAVEFIGRREEKKIAFPLDSVKLLAPVPQPRKFFCLAGNYAEHIQEGGGEVREKDRITPRVFMKPPSTTVQGPGAPILISRIAREIDWEAELGVVIGTRGKYIAVEGALDYVLGYTCVNDVSERSLQVRERNETAEWDKFFDWLNGKWLDSFAPMGPWITTADEIADVQSLAISLSVNGKQKQSGNTGQMIFSVADLVSYISQMVTLEPGDVIATGTPSGVGAASGTFLKPGDEVKIEIEGIGTLESPVKAEKD